MKDNYIHICFVIDSSGSMSGSESDVVGGFKRLIEEQKAVKEGECSVSLFTFDSKVEEKYLGVDVSKVDELDYKPCGMTAMNDGIGTAVDKVGKWLSDMKEEERPSKVMLVIMTDGEENFSKEYSLSKVQEMLKHQQEVYNWSVIFQGTDITNKKTASDLGIKTMSFTSKSNHFKNYDILNEATTKYRCAAPVFADSVLSCSLSTDVLKLTEEFEQENNIKVI